MHHKPSPHKEAMKKHWCRMLAQNCTCCLGDINPNWRLAFRPQHTRAGSKQGLREKPRSFLAGLFQPSCGPF